jgi:hypothetical protein
MQKAMVAMSFNGACTLRTVGAGNLFRSAADGPSQSGCRLRSATVIQRAGVGRHEMTSVRENAEVNLMDCSCRDKCDLV